MRKNKRCVTEYSIISREGKQQRVWSNNEWLSDADSLMRVTKRLRLAGFEQSQNQFELSLADYPQ